MTEYTFEPLDLPEAGLPSVQFEVYRDGEYLGVVRHVFPAGRDPYWLARARFLLPIKAGFVPGEFGSREDAADAIAASLD